MSGGPIEFLGDRGPAHLVPGTEFGGADGLIQPVRKDGAFVGAPEAKGGHDLELSDDRLVVSEVSGILKRAGLRVGSLRQQQTGEPDDASMVADPVTGRLAPDSKNVAGGERGELSGMKP